MLSDDEFDALCAEAAAAARAPPLVAPLLLPARREARERLVVDEHLALLADGREQSDPPAVRVVELHHLVELRLEVLGRPRRQRPQKLVKQF